MEALFNRENSIFFGRIIQMLFQLVGLGMGLEIDRTPRIFGTLQIPGLTVRASASRAGSVESMIDGAVVLWYNFLENCSRIPLKYHRTWGN